MRFWRGRGESSENVYDHCGWCEREIRYGDVSVALTLNVERADERESIEVIRSDVVLILCQSCGDRLDTATLRSALASQRRA